MLRKWHVTPRSPYYEWVTHAHTGYTAPKHTMFLTNLLYIQPTPPTTKKQKELPTSTRRPLWLFFVSPIPPPKITSGTGSLPGLLLLDGDSEFLEAETTSPATRTLLLVRGLKSCELLGLGTAKHMEKMWKNIWFEDSIWHLEYFLAKDFKVVHVWKGTLAAFCFYEYKMSWSSAQFVGNRILIISFQTLTIGLMMQLHGRKQLLSLDFGRVFKCNSFKLIFLFRRKWWNFRIV